MRLATRPPSCLPLPSTPSHPPLSHSSSALPLPSSALYPCLFPPLTPLLPPSLSPPSPTCLQSAAHKANSKMPIPRFCLRPRAEKGAVTSGKPGKPHPPCHAHSALPAQSTQMEKTIRLCNCNSVLHHSYCTQLMVAVLYMTNYYCSTVTVLHTLKSVAHI